MENNALVKVGGILNAGGAVIQNVASPVLDTDVATKIYVDTRVPKDGSGNFDIGSKKLINVAAPTLATDAANKSYIDTRVPKDGSGNFDIGSKKLINVAAPTLATDVTNKSYVDTRVPKDGSGNFDIGSKKLINVAAPTLVADATNKSYVDNLTAVKSDGGLERVANELKLNVGFSQSIAAPLLTAGGLEKNGSGEISASLLLFGGIDKDITGKLILDPAVAVNAVMQDGGYDPFSVALIKKAAAHFHVSDVSKTSLVTLSGDDVDTLLYQGLERINFVKYSNGTRPQAVAANLVGKYYNYMNFDGVDDRLKATGLKMDLFGLDKTTSVTCVYKLNSVAGAGLHNGLFGNDNLIWDKFVAMFGTNDLVISNTTNEPTSYAGGDNIVITSFPANAAATAVSIWNVITVTWAPHLGVNGSQVWCNGKLLRTFSAKDNPGSNDMDIGSIFPNGAGDGFLNGQIAEFLLFKEEDQLNKPLVIKRLHKHLCVKYEVIHDPIPLM